jgi:acid phosphatase type 7
MERRDFIRTSSAAGVDAGLKLTGAQASEQTAMPLVAPDRELVGVPVVGHTTPTESTILWAAKGLSTSWIEYGETADLGTRVDNDDDGLRSYDDVMHRVTLTGLKPGTRYFYRAHTRAIDFENAYSIKPGEMLVSEIGSFITLDPDAPETSFIVWNDTHNDKETIVGLHELSARTPHDFLFFNGDVSDYVDDEADMVGLYVNPHGQPFAQNAPLLFARGNHDVRGRAARHLTRYIAVPDGRFYYSFKQGPMAAIVLDTGEDKPDDHAVYGGLNSFAAYRTRQALWLEKEIQKPEFRDAPFRILFCHIPLRGKDGDEENTCLDGLAKWHTLLEEGKIQAVVSGHTHESVVLPPTKAHSYYQIIGGGPSVEIATLIQAHATNRQMTFTITNLEGKKLNEVVLNA